MNASPRIEPLPPQEWGELTEILEAIPAVGDFSLGSQNIFSTLARHPDLFRSWLPFGGYMLGGGTLPARDRELLILRTAVRCGSSYEWGQHVRIALRIGVEREAIDRVPIGAGAEGWTEHERALLQAADELHDDSSLSDPTWAALAQRYDQRQLIETAFLVGQYHLVAFALNACQVALDEGLEPLPSPLA
jgi:4-carboxymuconolactone decarboxylase